MTLTMYETQKATLRKWAGELDLWSERGEHFRFEDQPDERGRLILCTTRNTYSIGFSENHLSCGASSRIVQAGESWTRGNDIWDGVFCRETWDKIVQAILGYELVALVPESKPVSVAATNA